MNNRLQLLGLIVIEPLLDAKSREQGRGEKSAAGRGPDEGNRGRFNRTLRALGPWSMMMSSLKSSIAG